MASRGRPRKNPFHYSVENYIEYTSDSDSDANNVQNNAFNIDRGSLRSLQRVADEEMDQLAGVDEIIVDSVDEIMVDAVDEIVVDAVDEIMVNPEMEVRNHPPLQQENHPVFPQPNNPVVPQPNNPVVQHENHPVVEQESDDEIFSEPDEEEDDYDSILSELKALWLHTEIDHTVSKTASELFWKIGLEFFSKMTLAQATDNKKKKTPQFQSIRKHMYEDLLPPIDLEIAYKNRENGIIQIVKETNTPLKRFPPSKFEKLYEIGTIKVCFLNVLIHCRIYLRRNIFTFIF